MTDAQRAVLEGRVRRRSTAQALALRSRIVQSPPLRAVVDDVADAVDDLPPGPFLRVAAGLGPAGRDAERRQVPGSRGDSLHRRGAPHTADYCLNLEHLALGEPR